jgi:hypothetical protein
MKIGSESLETVSLGCLFNMICSKKEQKRIGTKRYRILM